MKRSGFKKKGAKGERDLVHLFWEAGWAASRVAGSGSVRLPSPDIIAGNGARKIGIEAKVVGGLRKYFPKKEISELKEYCCRFGAEPWIAIKFDNLGWRFISLEDLEETKEGFVVSIKLAKDKGLLFEEFVQVV